MQDKTERHKTDLELLNLRLATAEAECEIIQQELLAIESSQTKINAKGLWNHTTVAAASVVAVASLLSSGVFHYAQSNVNESRQYDVSAMPALMDGQIVRSEYRSTNRKMSSRHTARAKKATSQQWGQSLVIPEPAKQKHHLVFDNQLSSQDQEHKQDYFHHHIPLRNQVLNYHRFLLYRLESIHHQELHYRHHTPHPNQLEQYRHCRTQ